MYLYIISIISLLHYPIFLSLKTNCLNYDIIQNKCNLCAYGFYLKVDVILKEWKCLLKNSEFTIENRKILISNEKETFLSYNLFDFIYTDIFECFSKETIFLENNFVLEEEIYLSKLLAKNVLQMPNIQNSFFRRIETKISIFPLYCSVVNITENCFKENEKIKLNFKRFNFVFYVSFSLFFENIQFDGFYAQLNTKIITIYTNTALFKGLFIIEPIFDKQNFDFFPELILNNCIFSNIYCYNENFVIFANLIKITSFYGNLRINNTIFENLNFAKSIILYDNQPENHEIIFNFNDFKNLFNEYQNKINASTTFIELFNVSLHNFIPKEIQKIFFTLFFFERWLGNFLINLIYFKNFLGSSQFIKYIYWFFDCSNRVRILNSNYENISNFQIFYIYKTDLENINISFSYIYFITTAIYIIGDNNILNYIKFLNISLINIYNINPILNYDKTFLEFENIILKIDKMIILNWNYSNFLSSNSLNFIYNSKIENIMTQNSFIILKKTNILIFNTEFSGLKCNSSLISSTKNDFIISYQTKYIYLNVYSFFFFKDTNYCFFNNSILENSTSVWIWDIQSTISLFFIIETQFKFLNYIKGIIWTMNNIKIQIDKSEFLFLLGIFENFNILPFRITQGRIIFNNNLFYEWLAGGTQGYFIGLEYCDGLFFNSKFYNVGWYFAIIPDIEVIDVGNIIWFWSTYNATIINCEFINIGNVSMFTGFILFTANIYPILISNCKFVAKPTFPINNFHMGLLSSSSPNISFLNNYIEGVKCPDVNVFDHNNGAFGFVVYPSYFRLKNSNTFTAINNSFWNCSCQNGGGFGIINFNQVILKNISFINSNSLIGGHFIIVSSSFVSIKQFKLINSTAIKSSLFFIQNIDYLFMDDCFFQYSIGDSSLITKNILNFVINNTIIYDLRSGNSSGFININSGFVIFDFLKIHRVYAKTIGGIILLKYGNLIIKNSFFEHFFSNSGSLLFAEIGNSIYLENITVYYGYANKNGIILINKLENCQFNKITIFNSFSYNLGIIQLKGNEQNLKWNYVINEIKCIKNVGLEGSCMFHDSSLDLFINNIEIIECAGTPIYLFSLFSNIIKINNLKFLFNYIPNYFIYASTHDLEINSVLFKINFNVNKNILFFIEENNFVLIQSLIFFFNFNQTDMFILVINSKNDKDIIINNIKFDSIKSNNTLFVQFMKGINSKILLKHINLLNTIQMENGLLDLENCLVKFENSLFILNQGLIVYLIDCILDLNSTKIILNTPYYDIYFTRHYSLSKGKIMVNNSIFCKNIDLSIKIEKSAFLFLENNIFISMNKINGTFSSALKIYNNGNISIKNCSFKNFYDLEFPGLEIINSRDDTNEKFINIDKSLFYNCSSYFVGAIKIEGPNNLIINNTIFEKNTVFSKNNKPSYIGVLYFECNMTENCLFHIYNSIFKDNFIFGYISAIFSESYIHSSNLTLINNTATLGQNASIYSFPIELIISPYFNQSFFSGIPFNLEIYLLDAYKTNFSLGMEIIASIILTTKNNLFTIQNTLAEVNHDLIKFKQLLIKTQPNQNIELEIVAKFFSFKNKSLSLKKKFIFYSSPCSRGEILLPNFSCKKCPQFYYSISNSFTSNKKCFPCPNNADCPGGFQITPKPGFWKMDSETSFVVECIIKDSCPGIESQCKKGSFDNLCHLCIFDYGRFDSEEGCEICTEIMNLALSRLSLMISLVIIYILVNTKKTASSNFGVISKIIMHHSQRVNMVMMNKNSEFPQDIKNIFASLKIFSFISEHVIANDCFMQKGRKDVENFYIYRVFISISIPIVIFLISLLVFLILSLIQKNFKNKFNSIILILLISIFIFYSQIIKTSLSLLNCIELNNINNINGGQENENINETDFDFLYNSPNLKCWNYSHFLYILVAGIFGIGLIGVGFPIFLLLILKKTVEKKKNLSRYAPTLRRQITENITEYNHRIRNDLNKINVHKKREIYNYFYKDYKIEYYYWELVLFHQKILLSFLYNLNEFLQEETITFLFISSFLSYYFALFKNPFERSEFNLLEKMSIIVTIITRICVVILKRGENINKYLLLIIQIIPLVSNLTFYIITIYLYYKTIKWKKNLQLIRKSINLQVLLKSSRKKSILKKKEKDKSFLNRHL